MSEHAITERGTVASPVRLRPTNPLEVPWVRTLEAHEEVRPFIVRWSARQHRETIADPSRAHWVVEDVASGRAVGFVILSGVATESVELVRIVLARRGEGLGRAVLKLLRARVFDEWGARRLWLDVVPHNDRARGLYESEGFQPPDPGTDPKPYANGNSSTSLIVLELRSGP